MTDQKLRDNVKNVTFRDVKKALHMFTETTNRIVVKNSRVPT